MFRIVGIVEQKWKGEIDMRLIDADALMEASKYEFWQDGSAITPIGEYILGKFRKLIRNMPTVEPERKKGKWIYKGEHGDFAWYCDGRGRSWHLYECDQCHKTEKQNTRFCPNCGTDMRGE